MMKEPMIFHSGIKKKKKKKKKNDIDNLDYLPWIH